MATLDLISPHKFANQDERKIGAAHAATRVGGARQPYRGRGYSSPSQSGRSAQQSYQPRSGYRGGYKGGRGGGGQSYAGRGKYQGRGTNPDDGHKLDKSILDQMSPKQRAAFYQGRDKIRSSATGNDGSSNPVNTDRNVGATIQMQPAAYTPPPPPIIQIQSNIQNKIGAIFFGHQENGNQHIFPGWPSKQGDSSHRS